MRQLLIWLGLAAAVAAAVVLWRAATDEPVAADPERPASAPALSRRASSPAAADAAVATRELRREARVAPAVPTKETPPTAPAAPVVEVRPNERAKTPAPPAGFAATAERAAALRRAAGSAATDAERSSLLADAASLERSFAPFLDALVRGELDHETEQFVLRADAVLEDRFRLPDGVAVVDGPTWRKADGLPGEVILRFPAGAFRFAPEDVQSVRPQPKAVVVEGAGIDATVLVGWSPWTAHRGGPRWTFRDCTVHCGDEEFIHGGSAEFRLERVRVVGCDSGAGGSEMFDGEGLAVAVDCRFEEGFGRTPGSTNLFEGDPLSVRLDRCTFVGPFREFAPKASVVVVATGCRFQWTNPEFAEIAGLDEKSLRKLRLSLVDCIVESVAERRGRWTRRQLRDLNPAWPEDPRQVR